MWLLIPGSDTFTTAAIPPRAITGTSATLPQRCAAVLALRAFVLSSPYDVPHWLPDVLMALVRLATEPPPIRQGHGRWERRFPDSGMECASMLVWDVGRTLPGCSPLHGSGMTDGAIPLLLSLQHHRHQDTGGVQAHTRGVVGSGWKAPTPTRACRGEWGAVLRRTSGMDPTRWEWNQGHHVSPRAILAPNLVPTRDRSWDWRACVTC